MSKTELQKVLPPETEVSRPFWEGCKAGELRMQHCSSCDRFQFYPRIVCSDCGGKELEWLPVSGLGVIASFTVVRRGISLAYDAPYVVVLIDLAEGVRMMSSLVGAEAESVSVGAAVQVEFEDWGQGYRLPVFRPV